MLRKDSIRATRYRTALSLRAFALLGALLVGDRSPAADKDIAFLAEHLAESAMDQRFASLPNWNEFAPDARAQWQVSLGYSRVRAEAQRVAGPMFALGAAKPIGEHWRLSGHVFYDRLDATGAARTLPLSVAFVGGVPLVLPADASLGGLHGTVRDIGGGIFLHRPLRVRGAALQLNLGLEWQSLRLEDFATSYRIVSGASAGAVGTIDFSGRYTHVSPLVGISTSWVRSNWLIAPHALFALPLPRRGVVGRIEGPGFDLAGDENANGFGKHFGDPYLALGCEFEYRPWRLSADIGAIVAQRLIEPAVHRGIDQDWLLSVAWHW